MYENGRLMVLNIDDILPNRFQPRIRFDEVKLQELSESIRKYGVIQPIVVRPINNMYEIIAGERRFKASKLANRTTIPAIVINLSDKDSEEIALLENVQRQELTAIEEAVSYKRILDMGYINQRELASKIGKSESTIANKIRLLNLDDQVQDALLHGKISERHARSLLRIGDRQSQVMMLNRIINERLTVKRTDDAIKNYLAEHPSFKASSVTVNNDRLKSYTLNDNSVTESLFDSPKSDVFTRDNSVDGMKNERRDGFMDIDKIMREAQDINVSKQPNDISDLMRQPSNENVVNSNVGAGGNVNVPINNDNKFVNLGSSLSEDKVVTPAPAFDSAVSFDSIFNQKPIASQSNDVVTENVNVSSNSNSYTPSYHIIGDDVDGINNVSGVNTVNQGSLNNVGVNSANQSSLSNVGVGTANQGSLNDGVSGNLNEYIMSSGISNDSVQNVSPNSQPSMMNNDTLKVPTADAGFRQVINLIRDCADKIEKLGYYIDVDEIDLEKSYQVTFKINK